MSALLQHKVIIFDWDDTLLSSSHLAAMGHRLDTNHPFSEPLKQQLRALEDLVNHLLSQAFYLVGQENIVIITNAEEGWVQLSAKKFIPNVIGNVRQCRIMSARSTYESQNPGKPYIWKLFAMHNTLQQCFGVPLPVPLQGKFGTSDIDKQSTSFTLNQENGKENVSPSDPNILESEQHEVSPSLSESSASSSESSSPEKTKTVRHLVSFGDSLVEQHAACHVGRLIDRCIVKCVKLMERPTLSQLLRQLQAVANKFQDVIDHPEPLILTTMHARDVRRASKVGTFRRAPLTPVANNVTIREKYNQ